MAYKMILNKEKFLKTEFGTGLQECIAAWDMYLTKLSGLNYQPSGEYAKLDEESDADLFGVFTADEYKTTFGLEVAMQL